MGKPIVIDELVRAALSIAQNSIGRKGAPEALPHAAAIDSGDLRQRSRAFVSSENHVVVCVSGSVLRGWRRGSWNAASDLPQTGLTSAAAV